MTTLTERYTEVSERLRDAERLAARSAGSVRLLAVSKRHPATAIRAYYAMGQREFGESYLQEALDKQQDLEDLAIVWHFIGPIQSNKTRDIAAHFDWVHGVDRLKVAERLSAQRPAELPPLNICIQVNTSGETSKAGVAPTECAALAVAVASLPRLRLRGLMTIPAPETDPQRQRLPFRLLRELLEELVRDGLELDTLSMGMSDDLEAAIAEGATLVRIGTALFGQRE